VSGIERLEVEMQVCVLGPVEVWDDGKRVGSLPPQACRLLAVLAVRPGQTVSTSRIAEYVAGGRLDGSTVRTAVSRLRKVLGSCVATEQSGYRLVLGDVGLDSIRFEQLLDAARTMGPQERRHTLSRALDLGRGEAFGEFGDEPWAQGVATRLDELRTLATEDLAETMIESGRFQQAVLLIEPQLARLPYRERPVGLLMRALAADGRVTEALRAFQRFRTQLREDVGVEPTSELRDLEVRMLGGLDRERDVEANKPHDLPTGTVTFLFTDVEGSTEMWLRDEAAMSTALAAHDQVIRSAVESCDGWVFKHTGDGICAVFTSARQAAVAAVQSQRQLELPVRMGMHTGEAELRNSDYFGPTLNRAARVMDAGHGRQILLSAATAELVAELELIDLGEYRLKGIAPSVRLFQLGRGEFAALRTPLERAGNIPTEVSDFVGRQDEIAGLLGEFAGRRVVTLVGVGGAGKTRLSIEAAVAAAPVFPDGCWFVELATVADAGAVEFAFAAGLGLKAAREGAVISGIVSALKRKRLLIVVDNCEHVLSAAAEAIETIVRACPTVTILATSREPLMVTGERLVPVPSLPLADAERLFIERARSEAPDLVIDDVQSAAITELCERLDRLPLAIELAASRVRALSPVELAADLDQRFRLLIGGRRTRIERHQTMRGTLDWSYELCGAIERIVFDRLSVFPAGFDRVAARAVASGDPVSDLEVVDVVPRLVDRSLVQRTTRPDGTSRYHLLETMRAYGREHLQDDRTADDTRERYARHIASRINALSLATMGPTETLAREHIKLLVPDCLAACTWFIDHHDLDGAVSVASFGLSDCEREQDELWLLIARAVPDGVGDRPEFLDYVQFGIDIDTAELSVSEQNRRAWELVDSGGRAPADFFFYPPHMYIEGDAESGMRPEDLLASLQQLHGAPLATRCHTEWAVMCNLAIARPDLAAEHLRSFEALIKESQSRTGLAMLAEVRGHVAWSAHDWAAAATWYNEALTVDPREPKRWFETMVSWYRLVALALSGHEISSTDLSAPWRWLREANLASLRWWGASATAVVLERLSNPDLASRFRRSVVQTDYGGIAEMMEKRLAGSGFQLDRETSDPVDLDELVDELFEFARQLPNEATSNTASAP
jgi:predicted ATPase/class 3 adenylate cyclase